MEPFVSIIIPAYNRSDLFDRALSSAVCQSYQNVEIIVIDDGSEEDLENVIRKHRKNSPFPIYYHKQKNAGPGVARKRGLDLSKGDFIQYLDSDESNSPEKLQRQVEALCDNPCAVVCISGWEIYDSNYHKLYTSKKNSNPKDLLFYALNARPWPTSAPLWKYPNKKIPYWLPFISGDDIVHDVSVGIANRGVSWLDDPLMQVYKTVTSLSTDTLKPSIRARRFRENYTFPLECFSLIQKAGLLKDGYYSEQLSERCYRIGFQFAVVGEKEYAIKLIKKAMEASTNPIKIFECRLALLAINAFNSKHTSAYQLLFKLHRVLNPYSIHAGKGINNLVSP